VTGLLTLAGAVALFVFLIFARRSLGRGTSPAAQALAVDLAGPERLSALYLAARAALLLLPGARPETLHALRFCALCSCSVLLVRLAETLAFFASSRFRKKPAPLIVRSFAAWGTAFVVTHDRDLVASFANRIFAFTAKGLVDWRGNYDDFLEKYGDDAKH